MPHIHVLATGGTIDKVYSLSGELEIGTPAVETLLAPVLTDLTYDVTPVLALDSLDMTDADRVVLCQAVDALPGRHVVITHGTDTMPETAAFLDAHLAAADQTVVLTGAMRPSAMASSDAAFNLGAAFTAVQLLPAGVHIVMSGRVFSAGKVAKDRERGVFVDQP
ncbi:asparaginase [Nocardioides jiangxiensis]|uniref:Asparaginase domain-containing protein n=1 Tax=Nocardioides jiangxiensis TaxID=3064524 RepID=A0ABT9B0Y4_9ACTN|nr:asparaginase domain-containing protein [Nocardioides sp. WY-20]MDO7866808.1 asparaginase domain-containing protein [Nocardioides sp. WY-20]